MENKRIKMFLIIVIIIIILATIGYIIIYNNYNKEIEEYIPEEEITDEQLRQTIVTLYFKSIESKELTKEARKIDAKELITNPYITLVNMLIEGPQNEQLEPTIPQGTKLIKAELTNDTLKLDFSEEFINNHIGGAEEESKTIYSIVNTVTELTEVNTVKILINGQENKAFNDNALNFSEGFIRKK